MSLYNQLFGCNPEFPVLLGMIEMTMSEFDRFRDVHLCDGGKNILVYTRCGGGNRQDHKEMYEKVRKHPLYLDDFDDEVDKTYSYIMFKVPEKYKDTAVRMFVEEPMSVGDMFEKECEEMNDPNSDAFKRAEKIAKIFEEAIKNAENGGIIMF